MKVFYHYLISVFTEDVLQLKVSMSNTCRKAHHHQSHNKKKHPNPYVVFLLQLMGHQLTLCVQEMESLSYVLDNLTGLQLIKVLPVLDMCEDGA